MITETLYLSMISVLALSFIECVYTSDVDGC